MLHQISVSQMYTSNNKTPEFNEQYKQSYSFSTYVCIAPVE